MRIRRLQVRDLRRYRELDIDLAPGVTVVRGPNEAGKSTIQRAIELALTRRVTSAAADLDSLRPWDAGGDARPWIAIEFEQDEEDGRKVTGTLEKSFAGQKGTVLLEYDGQTVSDPALADQVMAELSGIPTEPFFRSTASVRHHELSDLARDETALRDRLQASISGADRGTGRARKKLERALHDLTTKGEKNPGRLKVAEAAVASTAASVEQGELALAQLERDRDALSSARERRGDAMSALAERRSLLEKARQAERLEAERTAAQGRYDRFREAVDVAAELDALGQSHPSPNPLPVIKAAVTRLRNLDGTIRELRAALAGEVAVQFDVAPEPTWRPLSRWGILLVIIGLVSAVGGLVVEVVANVDLGALPQLIGIAAALIGLILAVVALWLRRGAAMESQLRDVEIDRRLRGRSEMEAELRQAEADTVQQLGALGLDDLAAAEDLLAREEVHVARINELSAQLDGLVGKEPRETLAEQRDAAALEIEQKGSALEALGPIAKEPRARERLEVEVRDQEVALERARDDEANARARVEANTVDAEQVAGEAERLAGWREQLWALQRRQRVLDTTLRSIERAEVATMKTATRYLEGHMVRDVAAVTGGRYRRVRVDDKTLDIEVHAPELDDWVPVSSLSQGTLDLVYLAARLGLVRLVTGDRRPPLVFDDPFVTLDDARATRALALLKRVATDFQIIYLTTSDRYDAAADAVVELPGPTAVDEGVEDPALADPESALVEGRGLIDGLPAGSATILFGLAAAIAWGAGDFGGGLLSRRTAVFGVVMLAQLTGMAIAAVLAVVRAEPIPTGVDLVWCGIAGVLGGVGITALYRGLAVGRMGIVAPVTGVLAAVIPVAAGIVLEGLPAPLVLLGIAVAIVAVVLVSRVEDEAGGRAGLNEALIAGVTIGLFGVALSQISDGHVFGALTLIRGVQAILVVVVVIVARAAWRPTRGVLPAILLVGVLDMAGNGFYLLGVQAGALAIAAILSSLYPVTTVILATVFLKERVTRDHAVGIALAVLAIVCIGLGST